MTDSRKGKTTLEYAKEVIDKTNGEYRIESSYIDAFTEVRFKHLTCGTYFDMKPNAFNNGQRCTNKECKRKRQANKQHHRSYNRLLKVVEKRKDHYKLLTKFSMYDGNESQIRLYCKICDRYFTMSAHSFMSGRGCYKCGLLRRRLKRMKNPDQFYREVHNVLGDSYTFESEYQGRGELVKIKHSCGYSWWAHPASLLAGQQCRKCYPKRGILRVELIKLLNKYQCVSVNHLRKEIYYSYDKIYIQHQCGRRFWQRVDRIRNPRSKYGICKECNRKKMGKDYQLSESEFLKRFSKLPFSKEYSVVGSYQGMFVPINIYHKLCRHHDDVTPQSLLRGRECKWCRNHRKSVGERLVCYWLDYMNINYEYPKKFDGLVDKGLLHYDFYLPDYNVLIEIQGIQHYEAVKHFGGEQQFEIQQKHDRMKRDYARKHGYKLIEIPTNKVSIKDTIHSVALGLIKAIGRNSMEQAINQNTNSEAEAQQVAKIVSSAVQKAIEEYNRGDNS